MKKKKNKILTLKKRLATLEFGSYKNKLLIYYSKLSIKQFISFTNLSKNKVLKFCESFFKKKVEIDMILSELQLSKIANHFEIITIKEKPNIYKTLIEENYYSYEKNIEKPPIITIMGHVDHGKTTLLEAIKNINVVKNEFGGITQHIGAYEIEYNKKPITFIDTPGHEAFLKIRSTGAKITDVVVLVVAADDGLKPQTIESIKLINKFKLPTVVFINKIDKGNQNVEKIKNDLANFGLMDENWGGKVIIVEGSAKNKQNLDLLLESLLLTAEMLELKTSNLSNATGKVIESNFNKNFGYSATLLIDSGKLSKSSLIIINDSIIKIKILKNDLGKVISTAKPSSPVTIFGLKKAFSPGEKWFEVENLKTANFLIDVKKKYANLEVKKNKLSTKLSVEEFLSQVEKKKVNIILKADSIGSLESIKKFITENLKKINDVEELKNISLNFLSSSIGNMIENDYTLAKTSNSIILLFNVNNNVKLTKDNSISIISSNIIYNLLQQFLDCLKDKFTIKSEYTSVGTAKIKQTFLYKKNFKIAGCKLTSGSININNYIKVFRNKKEIYFGTIKSLQFLKNKIKKVTDLQEFGLLLNNFNDILIDDEVEAFEKSK